MSKLTVEFAGLPLASTTVITAVYVVLEEIGRLTERLVALPVMSRPLVAVMLVVNPVRILVPRAATR